MIQDLPLGHHIQFQKLEPIMENLIIFGLLEQRLGIRSLNPLKNLQKLDSKWI
jgi:hypothetical protein